MNKAVLTETHLFEAKIREEENGTFLGNTNCPV